MAGGLARGVGLEDIPARSRAAGDDPADATLGARVIIPKPNGGGERPLGIPTIRDRVIQTAAKLVLEPIFEADFEDNAYGYRPVRATELSGKLTLVLICRGHTDGVGHDLSRYFDSTSS